MLFEPGLQHFYAPVRQVVSNIFRARYPVNYREMVLKERIAFVYLCNKNGYIIIFNHKNLQS